MKLYEINYCNSNWIKANFCTYAKDFDDACEKAKKIIKKIKGHQINSIREMGYEFFEF